MDRKLLLILDKTASHEMKPQNITCHFLLSNTKSFHQALDEVIIQNVKCFLRGLALKQKKENM